MESRVMNGELEVSGSQKNIANGGHTIAINGRMKHEDDNSFVFEDSDHCGFLLDKLNTLRKSKQFCDVVLQVGNQQDIHEIFAHRAVLASATSFFLDIFSSDSVSVTQPQVYKLLTGNYDVKAFECLIEYMYTSRLEIPKEKVKAVYGLANRLKMSAVAHCCGQFLASAMTPESCLAVRSIPGVLSDPILLNAVDNYIRQNISDVATSKYVEKLPKIQIEVLQNEEEREVTNKKHLFNLVLEWIRKSFSAENFNIDVITEKLHMLYISKIDKILRDCNDIEKGDTNYSDVIQDYKTLSRRLAAPKKNHTENGKEEHTPSKPRQFLFTRSDSDSSLSSLADDDENDWRVLATHSSSKHSIIGVVTIAGKLCHLSVKLRLNTPNKIRFESQIESVEKCDLYSSIPPMSCARCAVGTVQLQGQLLVCGGYDRGECLKSVEAYDSKTNKWSMMQSMTTPRGRFDVAVLNDRIYAVGGCDGQKELNSAEYFDLQTMNWKQLPSCPVVRSNAGVCALNEKIYVIGGWNGQRGLMRCDVFNPKTNEWSEIDHLQTGRYQTGVAVMNDEIYAVGGCDSWTCLNTVEKYCPQSDTWKSVAILGTSRRGCGVACFNGKLYAIGGHDGMYSLCSVEIYDPESNTWTYGPSLTSCRANVGVAVVGDRLYAVGGFTGKTFLQTVEYLDTKNNEWTTFIPKEQTDDRPNNIRNLENCLTDRHSTKRIAEPLVEVEGETG
ncbi:Influenza virus NS1A-binding-like protein [Leptotrombidium deliense]|uniref:Influenza virus NS1A-binding-like protein n=1 Tax=Leptotrombidium deliense TaxID=299467 RepID=A0A443SJR5_9ACAR|nr:Influenza virus NS1A-binding-like protein [Leptotrombidium deliense]